MKTADVIVDNISSTPRRWSNGELKKFAHLFKQDVINVSAWKDSDKQNSQYKKYFFNAKTYTISNYKKEARGFQHTPGEIFLDLTKEVPPNLQCKYSVVFNHTTLEHIYDFKKAFKNLCDLSNDILIIVVPFLQRMHGEYGDYWRFTPQALHQMCKDNNMKILYCSFNDHPKTSVYLFCIASKNPNRWQSIPNMKNTKHTIIYSQTTRQDQAGNKAIQNNIFKKIFFYIRDRY